MDVLFSGAAIAGSWASTFNISNYPGGVYMISVNGITGSKIIKY